MTGPTLTGNTVEIRKEIRFAVVLYGGVSLAVYIGGITREMLAMVRATALRDGNPGVPRGFVEEEASGSIAVYRRLAERLSRSPGEPAGTTYTRFVVDVISGTSAGGLNGVFLAKALARAQTLDHLRGLWLSVGDIVSLLNTNDNTPRSVLNGEFMLTKLRDAFVAMEDQSIVPANPSSSLVDDVVCFATTTDLRGLPIAIRLADKQIVELRNKHFYRFEFSNDVFRPSYSDFTTDDNPALALASRSTSAFPGAFAPLRVDDVPDLHQPDRLYPGYAGTGKQPPSDPPRGTPPFGKTVFDAKVHAFADGGILNNKPFAHAVGALSGRRGGKPSERRLIYVEPSPDARIDLAKAGTEPTKDFSTPGFLNVVQTAFALPSQQTIREDLERVLERNRTIDRMNGILADLPDEMIKHHERIVADLTRLSGIDPESPPAQTAQRLLRIVEPTSAKDAADAFSMSDVGDMLGIFGLGYGGYHRLKVAAVTDDVSRSVARLFGIDDQSDVFIAIRALVRAWRDLRFAPYTHDLPPSETERARQIEVVLAAAAPERKGQTSGRASENVFLFEWDLRYRLRRLDFALNKIDDLYCLDDRGIALLRSFGVNDAAGWMNTDRRDELASMAQVLGTAYAMLNARADALDSDAADRAFDLAEWVARMTKQAPTVVASAPPARPAADVLSAAIDSLGITSKDLLSLLGPSEHARSEAATRLVAERYERFDLVADRLASRIREATILASAWSSSVLPEPVEARNRRNGRTHIRAGDIIRFFYDNYEAVDRITFPVFYQTAVGEETDTVAVMRISPEDAVAIVPEPPPGEKRRMLGGETLSHFGGFFAKSWRAYDFLWGQLDGAERLITAACLGATNITAEERNEFIRDAQVAILADDANVDGLPGLMEITGPDRAADRYEYLRRHHTDLLRQGSEFERTFVASLRGALPILGRIFKKGEPGTLGKIGSMAGGIVVYIAESAIDDHKNTKVQGAGWAMTLLGGLAIVFGLFARNPTWNPWIAMPFRGFSVIGCVIGGALLAGLGQGLLFVQRKIAVAFEKLRKQVPE